MRQKGFTLVELLLATAMFSFILLFVTAAFVQVSRAYNKGILVKRTQETARAVVQELTRTIGTATSGNGTDAVIEYDDNGALKRLCVGNIRYGWNEGYRTDNAVPNREDLSNGDDFALVRSNGECTSPFVEDDSVELIDQRLTLQDIDINQDSTGTIFNLCVIISSNSLGGELVPGNCASPPQCNVVNGDTYCDIARLETTVTLRR